MTTAQNTTARAASIDSLASRFEAERQAYEAAEAIAAQAAAKSGVEQSAEDALSQAWTAARAVLAAPVDDLAGVLAKIPAANFLGMSEDSPLAAGLFADLARIAEAR